MYSTAYNLWTFTWFVHFELSGWKGLKKFIPRDSPNSPLIYILFSMYTRKQKENTLKCSEFFKQSIETVSIIKEDCNIFGIKLNIA